MKWLQHPVRVLVKAGENTFINHDGVEHAGYLSFMGLLSLFPFLVFIVALLGAIGEGQWAREVIGLMRDLLPQEAVAILLPRIDEIMQGPPRGLLTISMLAALWTASSAVEGYRTVLNRAYHVGTPPSYLWRRFMAIVQLLLFAVLLILGMGTLILAPSLLAWLETTTGLALDYAEFKQSVFGLQWLSGALLFCVVALTYFYLPNIRQTFFAVWPGALLTVCLWALAVKGLRLYLSTFEQMNVIYGSLAGMIAALLFFFIINLIFIFGAEFNYLLMRVQGEKIEEREVTEDEA